MIRRLQTSDLPRVLELFSQLGEEHHGWSSRIDAKWFEGELKHGHGLGLFMDGLQGMIFYRLQPDVSEITYIMVAPGALGSGVAERLMNHYLSEITKEREVWLEVHEANQRALAFYRKWGFVETGRRGKYYPDRGAAICLARR